MSRRDNPHAEAPAESAAHAQGVESAGGAAWSHWVSFLLGLMLFVAPWAVGYAQSVLALILSLFLGPVIAIFAFLGLVAEPEAGWLTRVVFLAGLLAFIAPFVLGLAIPRPAAWSLAVLGGLAVVVSATPRLARPAGRPV